MEKTMGKRIAQKQAQAVANEQKIAFMLKRGSQQAVEKHNQFKQKSIALDPLIFVYEEKRLKDIKSFQSKLKSDDPERRRKEQIKYFFSKYPVSKCIESVWNLSPAQKQLFHAVVTDVQQKSLDSNIVNSQYLEELKAPRDVMNWYFAVAQGESLFKTYAKGLLTKKEVFYLYTCPYDIDFYQGVVYSIAKAAGASEGIASMLYNSKLATESILKPFYQTVVRFFVQNPAQNKNEINDLVDYLVMKHRTTPGFSMAGQHLSTIRVKNVEWHYQLRREKVLGSDVWQGHDYSEGSYISGAAGDKYLWTMTQICNAKDLAAEGTAMRHCVLSYKARCIDGTTSIWSLKVEHCTDDGFGMGGAVRKLTVEVNVHSGIVQARGLANRAARDQELAILRMWARENGVSFSQRYF